MREVLQALVFGEDIDADTGGTAHVLVSCYGRQDEQKFAGGGEMGTGASKKLTPVERVKTVYLRVSREIVPVSALDAMGAAAAVAMCCTLQRFHR